MKDLIFPRELTPELGEVLGLMLWDTGLKVIARCHRDAGAAEIPRQAEAEQAFALHWLITLALEHGPEWRRKAADRIHELRIICGGAIP